MTGLQYTLLHPWLSLSRRRAPFAGLREGEERFLSAPDSMTSLLEGLYKDRIEVTATLRGRRAMDSASAALLHAREGDEALVRGVWIKAGREPLIYALSLIPTATLDRGLLSVLEGGRPEPMGRTLNRQGVAFTKKDLEAGVIKCPLVAEGLGCGPETPFLARRYVLEGEKNKALAIRAAITEVFSPALISAKHLGA